MTGHKVKFNPQAEDPEAQDELWWGRGVGAAEMGAIGGLTLYRCHHEQTWPGDYNILFSKKAYRDVVGHLKEDTKREHGGLLLGFATGTSGPGIPSVLVSHALRAAHTKGTPTSLTFTEQTWAEWDNVDEEFKRLGLHLDRVGWYHSHPNIEIFLSRYDLDVCSSFKRLKCPVALVVDPIRDRGGFFIQAADGYHPDSPKGFWEIHGDEEAGVAWKNLDKVRFPESKAGETGAASSPVEPLAAGPVVPVVDDEPPRPPASSKNGGNPSPAGLPVAWVWGLGLALAVVAGSLAVSVHQLNQTAGHLNQISQILSNLNGRVLVASAPPPNAAKPSVPRVTVTPAADPPAATQTAAKPSPSPAALDPTTVPLNAALDVTVRGTGLSGTSKVFVNGKDRKPKSVADTAVIFPLKAGEANKQGDLKVQLVIAGKMVPKPLTLKVSGPVTEKAPDLSITTKSLPDGTAGVAYSALELTATGGTKPYKWKAEGLPPGLTLVEDTGKLEGTPASGTKGDHPITLTVTDKAGATFKAQPLQLTVKE